MKKTVVLLRVSTDMQETISQRTAIEDYISKNKIIVDRFIEEDGVSGFKTKLEDRKGLMQIKDMAINNELDTLIVFNSDRIGRRMEMAGFITLLDECDVKVYSITEGLLNKGEDTDDLLNAIKFWTSSYESKKIAERVKAGKKATALKGGFLGGVPNFGYKLVDKKLEVFEEEAKVVRLIFNMYIEDGTTGALNYLEENNILKRGGNWTRTNLIKTLKNTIYRGQKQFKEAVIPQDENLRIVSDEVFYLAQDRMKSRTTKAKGNMTKHLNRTNALFESILYHECKDREFRKLYIDYNKSKKDGEVRLYYRCAHCRQFRLQGVKKNYSGKKYEKIIEDEIKDILTNLSVEKLEEQYNLEKLEEVKKIEVDTKDIEQNIQKKKLALHNATKELEKVFAGESDMSLDTLNNLINTLKIDIEQLENDLKINNDKLSQINIKKINSKDLADKYKNFTYLYNIASIEDKKKILQELIDKIVIYQEYTKGFEEEIEIKLNM